jgi:DNA-binding GntR family transcriptional regulator
MGPQSLERVNDDHRAILEAVRARDADEAEHRMREHLGMLRETYVRLWAPDGARLPSGSGVGD